MLGSARGLACLLGRGLASVGAAGAGADAGAAGCFKTAPQPGSMLTSPSRPHPPRTRPQLALLPDGGVAVSAGKLLVSPAAA